ncbi:MAG: inositol monophosphatase [Alphaproteobacteria bacterium]
MTQPPAQDLESRHALAEAVAREAGIYALGRFRDRAGLDIGSKGAHDDVSDADRQTEALIRRRIAEAFPDDGILGEEGGRSEARNDWLWVVDPIDGTSCFVAGIPVWCVSVAAVHAGRAVIGVVEDPNAGETFSARAGGPATLNGSPIGPSGAIGLGGGSVGVGHSMRIRPAETIGFMTRLLEGGGMFQRNGSGALMLSYVAAGRLIGYYEAHINSWDCLAALVLIECAGGWHNDFLAGDGLTRGNPVLAAAPGVADALRGLAGL